MEYESLYKRLAVSAPGDVSLGGRTVETKMKETVDNDQESLLVADSLVGAERTRLTATKETIDNDQEALLLGGLVPPGPGVTRAAAALVASLVIARG